MVVFDGNIFKYTNYFYICEIYNPPRIPERIARLADAVDNKYDLHEFEAKSMSEIIGKYGMELFHLYNKSFSKLEEFSPLTDKQIEQYIASYKSVLNPDFVALVVSGKGELPASAYASPPSPWLSRRAAAGCSR